jgi:transcriptional regulator with XRE-family HTH domain
VIPLIGIHIKKRRKELRLSREELAELIGVTGNSLYRWETGERSPSDENKRKLARALGVSLAYLLGETDDLSLQDAQSKNYLIDTMNNSGTANVANRMDAPPPEVISISVGDIRMEFPKGTPADVIGKAIESARKGRNEE